MLHGRIVEAIEALVGERVAEQVERLAHHALRGEVWDKALAYFRQAGEKAMARSAYREAVGYVEQAIGTLPHLPEQRDTREQAIDLRFALRSALRPSGDSGGILAYLREAEALAVALDDPRRLAQVSLFLSLHLSEGGAYDEAIAAAQRALALATASGEVVLLLQAQASRYLGQAYRAQGDYRRAIDCLRQAMAVFEGARRYERFGLVNLPRALHRLERAVGICHEADLPAYFPLMAAALGAAYSLAGRVADAVPLLTQAMQQNAAMGEVVFPALCGLSLEEAHALAERALALARAHQERGHQAYALRLLGDIAARHDPPERELAETHYRQALALAEARGIERPLVAHCHLGLGTLYATSGRRAEARTELSAAIELYRAMDMTFWLPQTEMMLAQVEGR